MTHYGKGKYSFGICDRSGKKVPYRELVEEPGTGLVVHYTESDKQFNAVDHPQNKPPQFRQEMKPFRDVRNGSTEVVLTTVSVSSWLPPV